MTEPVVAAAEPDARQRETLIQEIGRRYTWPATYRSAKQVCTVRIQGSSFNVRLLALTGAFGDPAMQVQVIQVQPDKSKPQLFVYLNLPLGGSKHMLLVVRQRYDEHTRKMVREFEERYEIHIGTWVETLRAIARVLHEHRREIFADALVEAASEPESACFLVQEIRRHQNRTVPVKLFGMEFVASFVYSAEADRAMVVLQSKGTSMDVEITIDVNNHPTTQAVSAYFVTRVKGGSHSRSVDLDVLEKQASTWGLNQFMGYIIKYLNEHVQELEREHLILLPIRNTTAATEPNQRKSMTSRIASCKELGSFPGPRSELHVSGSSFGHPSIATLEKDPVPRSRRVQVIVQHESKGAGQGGCYNAYTSIPSSDDIIERRGVLLGDVTHTLDNDGSSDAVAVQKLIRALYLKAYKHFNVSATAAAEPQQTETPDHAYQDLARKVPATETETLHCIKRMKKLRIHGSDVYVGRSTTSPFIYVGVMNDSNKEHWQEAKLYNEHDGSVQVRMVLRFEHRVIEHSARITGGNSGVDLLKRVVSAIRAELGDYGVHAATEPKPSNETENESPYVILDEIPVPTPMRMKLHRGIEIHERGWTINIRTGEFGSLDITTHQVGNFAAFHVGVRYVDGKYTLVLNRMSSVRTQVLRLSPKPGLTVENLLRVLTTAVLNYVTEQQATSATEPGLEHTRDVLDKIYEGIAFQPGFRMHVPLPGHADLVKLSALSREIHLEFDKNTDSPVRVTVFETRNTMPKTWKITIDLGNGVRVAGTAGNLASLMYATDSNFRRQRHKQITFFAAAVWRMVEAARRRQATASAEPGLGNISPTYQKFYKLAYADFKKPLATKRIRGYEISIHAHDDKESLDPDNLLFYVSTPATPEYTQMFTTDLFDIAEARIQITLKHELRVEVIPVDDNVDSGSARSHTTFPLDAPVQPVLRFIFDTVGKYNIRERVYNAE